MATTTNYGWTTPDDTALVKDGASAIRTLGSSVDTTVKNLNPETTLGDISYRSSTANTNTRLAIGSTGDVLTVSGGLPTWAAPSAGGITQISSTSASNSATIDLTSIPATYKDLYIIVRNFKPATDASQLQFRFNSDATASRHSGEIQSFNVAESTFGATRINITNACDNSVANGLTYLLIPDYANTTTWKNCFFFSQTTSDVTTTKFQSFSGWGFYNQTGAISSLQFLSSSGNITSGTFILYGVK